MNTIYKEMTKGTWYISGESESSRYISISSLSVKKAIVRVPWSSGTDAENGVATDDADSKAIVKSINATYGKGIDPEYLDNLIKCMNNLIEIIQNDGLMFDGFPPLVNARAALESIKLENKS